MTTASLPSALDFHAAARWPIRAAAHLLGVGLLLAVLVALPVAPTDLDRHQLPKESVVHLFTWLAVMLARPLPTLGLRPAARWSLVALVVVTIISAILAANGWLAWRAAALLITGCAAFITARHVAALGNTNTLLVWCAVAGLVGAGTGLAQAYGADSWLFASTRLPGGTFGNRNFMAHFAALALPLFILLALTARARALALLGAVGAGALLAAAVISRSRAAWIGVALALVLFAIVGALAHRRRVVLDIRRRAMMLAALLAAGTVAALVIPNRLSWRSASPYADTLAGLTNHDEGSGHGRILQYRNTIHLAMLHPILGVGPGNWPVRYGDVAPANDPTWVYGDAVPINPWPSSDWMAMLSEMGVIAVAAALLFGASIAWRGLQAARAHGDRVIAGAALLATVATTFVEGSFDAVLLLPVPMLFVAMSCGALLERCDDPANLVPHSPRSPSRLSYVLTALLCISAVRSAMQTTAYIVAGNGKSLSRLAWAGRIDPGSYPIRLGIAQRATCASAHDDVVAVAHMAPTWPASMAAARRCGVRIGR